MNKSEIKQKLTIRNTKNRYLINNLLVGIDGALDVKELKADADVCEKLQAFKDDLLSIECPIHSQTKRVKEEDQIKADSIGSKAYILIANYLHE